MKQIELKVLSYNIHKGFSAGRRKFMLKRMRELIRGIGADLVFLQEVLGKHDLHARRHRDWPTVSQFEYLADELWPHFAYGKNAIYDAGHHGNAILSRYPFESHENIDISTYRLEQRGMLHGSIRLPGHSNPLHAICVHLGLFEGDRARQIKMLCQRVESHVPHGEPLLIGGDFNDWRGTATRPLSTVVGVRELFEELAGEHARTFPSWLPVLRLDRIYYRGLRPGTARILSDGAWNALSDHAALIGGFRL